LSHVEVKTLQWINLDPTRPFCSRDLWELNYFHSKGTARNIICKLKKYQIIELFCHSRYAFYKLKSVDRSKIKKPITVYRIGGSGLKRLQVDFVSILESLPMEELCKVHDVHLTFKGDGFYQSLINKRIYKVNPVSKDLDFGSFPWSKYRSLQVVLHKTGCVSFVLDCTNCPIEASAVDFVKTAGFLGGIRNQLLNTCKQINPVLSETSLPAVEEWTVVQWHYGRDSTQEFSGEGFNVSFRLWCGELARIYIHEHDRIRKVRMEVIECPRKPLEKVIEEKLNLCCSRCRLCIKH
jgi:hypothetical protein